MPTKKQHFVPCVYLKAWETKVETIKEPNKKFDGVYVFQGSNIGDVQIGIQFCGNLIFIQ
jgi:hypothetical protein